MTRVLSAEQQLHNMQVTNWWLMGIAVAATLVGLALLLLANAERIEGWARVLREVAVTVGVLLLEAAAAVATAVVLHAENAADRLRGRQEARSLANGWTQELPTVKHRAEAS